MSTNVAPGINPTAATGDMKFEIVVIPVSDADRAKAYYAKLGWRLDADFDNGKDFRVIQFTPPGSGCSVIFGQNVTPATPGSAQGLYLIVADIAAARKALLANAWKVLNDRQRHILTERRMKEDPATLEELAIHYGISRERVRQIEVRALETLRKAMKVKMKEGAEFGFRRW